MCRFEHQVMVSDIQKIPVIRYWYCTNRKKLQLHKFLCMAKAYLELYTVIKRNICGFISGNYNTVRINLLMTRSYY